MEAGPTRCTDQLLVAHDDSICCFAILCSPKVMQGCSQHFLNCYSFCQGERSSSLHFQGCHLIRSSCLQHASVTDQSTHCGLPGRQHPSLWRTLGTKPPDAQLGNPTPEESFGDLKTAAPKKKTILLWQCCVCANSGIPLAVEACENCGTTRCAYCKVVRVKGKAPFAVNRLEHADSDVGSDWEDDSALGLNGAQNGFLCNYDSN